MLELSATPQFQKDLRKIPRLVIDHAEGTIQRLRSDPIDRTLSIKKLKNIKPVVWRVRIGSYRLVYSFDKTRLILHRIRHRKDIYRHL